MNADAPTHPQLTTDQDRSPKDCQEMGDLSDGIDAPPSKQGRSETWKQSCLRMGPRLQKSSELSIDQYISAGDCGVVGGTLITQGNQSGKPGRFSERFFWLLAHRNSYQKGWGTCAFFLRRPALLHCCCLLS